MKKLTITIICMIPFLFAGCFHSHQWTEASCVNPITCIKCGETQGTRLGHRYSLPTCTTPMKCSRCGATQGTATGHKMIQGTNTSPSVCTVCNYMKPLALPQNGQVFIGSELYRNSELTIHGSDSYNCYVKLKSTIGNDVFSFFVRAGKSVTVSVPSDYYYVYFSYGKDWYGTKYIFGPNTTYSKDDEICDFKNYTWEYTLYSSYDGNFTETPVSAEEFQ